MNSCNIIERYYPIEETDGVNAIHVRLYYSLGGMNYFTYKNEPRGYYVSVSPVKLTKTDTYNTISTVAFSGTKWILEEVKRKSAKAEQRAVGKLNESLVQLIDYVCNDQRLPFPNLKEEL